MTIEPGKSGTKKGRVVTFGSHCFLADGCFPGQINNGQVSQLLLFYSSTTFEVEQFSWPGC